MMLSDEDVIGLLDQASIRTALITGFDEAQSGGTTFVSNESVAALSKRHPDRFIPFCGADVFRGAPAVREMEHWIVDHGFRGARLRYAALDQTSRSGR